VVNYLELAKTAVAADLFSDGGLTEELLTPAPEKYQLMQRLGRGGFGAVYLARDLSLGRLVALKYLYQTRAAELERFCREARFAARLNNPSIVQVYEAGEVEGVPFIAMQYIAGGNLATVELDMTATVRVMWEVAGALAHAHGEGIVHRDVKPANILLDGEARAYVSDFGIARDLRGEIGTTLSQDGQIIGTPELMSPEQARGDVHRVNATSDIYTLGATLYCKLTGRAPFTGENLVDLLHAVIHDDPPFPRRFNASIPRDMEALILRCMRKRQEDRFATMRDVMSAFERHLSGGGQAGLSSAWFTTYVRRQVDEAPAPAPPQASPEIDWRPALEAAQEIAAWDTQLYRERGDVTRHHPRLDALIARMDGVLASEPGTAWARFYRGVAWFRRGDLPRALDDMERAIDRMRDLAAAYFELGRLYLALYLEEQRAAREHMSAAATDGQVRVARDRLHQAGIALAEARRLKPDLPGWQAGFVDAVQRLADRDHRGCIARCDAILESDPDLEEVWKLKGDAIRWMGGDPLPAYARAVDARRSYHEANLAMAEVHVDGERPAEARECLAQALETHSGLVAAELLWARTYLIEARAGGGQGSLRLGVERATAVWERHRTSYRAAVTLAELEIEMARASGAGPLIAAALDRLARARQLPGCAVRVTYLEARARLARAELAVASDGADRDAARADVDAVLALRDQDLARVADRAPWLALFAEAERVQRELGAA
jgi:tetratricopeptide (TPR) repeat protein/predicted Ser/Thr protein kinase